MRVQLSAALTGVVSQCLVPRIGGGLVAAYEVLAANSAVRSVIKEGNAEQLRECVVTGAHEGMMTFEMSLSELVRNGEVSYETALARSLHPQDIQAGPRPRASVPG